MSLGIEKEYLNPKTLANKLIIINRKIFLKNVGNRQGRLSCSVRYFDSFKYRVCYAIF